MADYFSEQVRLFRKIFAISSLIQGCIWFGLSLTCIVLYYAKPDSIDQFSNTVISEKQSFLSLISWCFYDTLLDKNSNNKNRTLLPINFHIIVWVYAFASSLWTIAAICEVLVIFKNKLQAYTAYILIILGLFTIQIAMLDAIIFVIALIDYSKINPFDYSLVYSSRLNRDCDFELDADLHFRYVIGRKISFGILTVLAAKGFVLWFLNCAAGFIALIVSKEILQLPSILYYSDTIPRAKLQKNSYMPESRRSSVEPAYIGDPDISNSFPTEKVRSWYKQEAPYPNKYQEQSAAPRFANPRNKTYNNQQFS